MESNNATPKVNGRVFVNADSIAGAGGGMLLAQIAQNLPDAVSHKSLLINLVPVMTLVIKRCWNFFELEVLFSLNNSRANHARNRYVRFIDRLMDDSRINDEIKAELKEVIVYSQLSTLFDLFKHWKENYQRK